MFSVPFRDLLLHLVGREPHLESALGSQARLEEAAELDSLLDDIAPPSDEEATAVVDEFEWVTSLHGLHGVLLRGWRMRKR